MLNYISVLILLGTWNYGTILANNIAFVHILDLNYIIVDTQSKVFPISVLLPVTDRRTIETFQKEGHRWTNYRVFFYKLSHKIWLLYYIKILISEDGFRLKMLLTLHSGKAKELCDLVLGLNFAGNHIPFESESKMHSVWRY